MPTVDARRRPTGVPATEACDASRHTPFALNPLAPHLAGGLAQRRRPLCQDLVRQDLSQKPCPERASEESIASEFEQPGARSGGAGEGAVTDVFGGVQGEDLGGV